MPTFQAYLRCTLAECHHDQSRHECDIFHSMDDSKHGRYEYLELQGRRSLELGSNKR